jgi:hypothetical protein
MNKLILEDIKRFKEITNYRNLLTEGTGTFIKWIGDDVLKGIIKTNLNSFIKKLGQAELKALKASALKDSKQFFDDAVNSVKQQWQGTMTPQIEQKIRSGLAKMLDDPKIQKEFTGEISKLATSRTVKKATQTARAAVQKNLKNTKLTSQQQQVAVQAVDDIVDNASDPKKVSSALKNLESFGLVKLVDGKLDKVTTLGKTVLGLAVFGGIVYAGSGSATESMTKEYGDSEQQNGTSDGWFDYLNPLKWGMDDSDSKEETSAESVKSSSNWYSLGQQYDNQIKQALGKDPGKLTDEDINLIYDKLKQSGKIK